MEISASIIRDTALNILARREHSEQELTQKLMRKYQDKASMVGSVISQLQTENIQSDKRFAASFLRRRLLKRHGKNRIIKELKFKGVQQEDIEWAFQSEPEVDWFELAKELKQLKFGHGVTQDYKEKSKQFRYLQYRGFTFDEINYATQSRDEEDML